MVYETVLSSSQTYIAEKLPTKHIAQIYQQPKNLEDNLHFRPEKGAFETDMSN